MFQSLLSDELQAVVPAAYFPSASYGLAMATAFATTAATDALVAPPRDAPSARSLPDKLRCGYTSKRCENPRTVKKSGGLHRFCAYHRERANKNQWRVDNRRRILRRLSQPSKSGSDCGSPRSTSSDVGEDGEVPELFDDGERIKKESEQSALADLLDPAGSPNTLSEQDATILNAMLFSDEDELAEATRFGEMQVVAVTSPTPALVSPALDCQTTYVVSGSLPCACSQCMAWSTMYYFQDALDSARKCRVQTYSRV